jgi:signal transduction histidine kinase
MSGGTVVSRIEWRQMGLAVTYGMAMVIVVNAAEWFLPLPPFVLLLGGVALVSRYAGGRAALIASLMGLVAVGAGLLQYTGISQTTPLPLWMRVGTFGIVAFTIEAGRESLRRARHVAEKHARDLDDANRQRTTRMWEVESLSADLYKANAQLASARDAAMAAADARQDVLAIVAHDLRNPLNVVSNAAQLFMEMDRPDSRRRLLDTMQRAVTRMNRLIEDLLDVARMDAGRFTLHLDDVSVNTLLENTAEMFDHAGREKGISLTIEPCGCDVLVKADAERVLQAIGNLVGNALKFAGRDGSVSIRCNAMRDQAVLSVTDTGRGIPPEKLQHLFDPFWQERDDRRGVGLGLTIARGIIEAHGGQIWAESEVGIGSTFYCSLPVIPARDVSINAIWQREDRAPAHSLSLGGHPGR